MVSYHDLVAGLRKLGIERSRPVIVHGALSAFGHVQGGADTVVGAMLASFEALMMPVFTYQTMVTPLNGPADNALEYGTGQDRNSQAVFFRPDLPADRLMGIIAETLRNHPNAQRSWHPILSFAGVNVWHALDAQSLVEPLASVRVLMEDGGWVLLLGVDQAVNTSIHLGERLAGRKQFVRWALTPGGVVECPAFPGCSDGFEEIKPAVRRMTRQLLIGSAVVQALPLTDLVQAVQQCLAENPLALLCDRSYCERCQVVRAAVARNQS